MRDNRIIKHNNKHTECLAVNNAQVAAILEILDRKLGKSLDKLNKRGANIKTYKIALIEFISQERLQEAKERAHRLQVLNVIDQV